MPSEAVSTFIYFLQEGCRTTTMCGMGVWISPLKCLAASTPWHQNFPSFGMITRMLVRSLLYYVVYTVWCCRMKDGPVNHAF